MQHVHSEVQLLVLQHPEEVGHAKNTARLLHRCLPDSQLLEGEVWEPDQLHTALHAPWPGQAADADVHTVLLYPPSPPTRNCPWSHRHLCHRRGWASPRGCGWC